MDDLRNEIISAQVARDVYRVVYDGELLKVDLDATDEERRAAREERKANGKPFDAFVAEWSQLRPSEDKLTYYGSWPEPNVETYTKPFWGLFE
jgi:acetone carboxylase alpha subunit